MNTYKWLYKVTRPVGFIAAGLASWVIAIVCNGPNIFSSNKIAAGAAMALNCLGASVFHFGAANRMYARKVWDVVPIEKPWKLVLAGACIFASSLLTAWKYLPSSCLCIIACNILILVLYARTLSSTWWTKNWCMAYVCSTPILLGWLAGSHPSPILPLATGSVFCLYWSKEIIKDVLDIKANCGIRVTLPIRFGIPGALRVGGVLAALDTAAVTGLAFSLKLPLISTIAIYLAISLFGFVSWRLCSGADPVKTNTMITVGSYCLIASILISRL
jgi:hypothetical protein